MLGIIIRVDDVVQNSMLSLIRLEQHRLAYSVPALVLCSASCVVVMCHLHIQFSCLVIVFKGAIVRNGSDISNLFAIGTL